MENITCIQCHQSKPAEAFRFRNRPLGKRDTKCKECSREYHKRYYANSSPEKKQEKSKTAVACNKRRRAKLRGVVWEHLLAHHCVDCGEADPVVLEFDHRDPEHKTESICGMLRDFADKDTLLAEIAKCDVRCANCHRRRTAKQFGWHELRNMYHDHDSDD